MFLRGCATKKEAELLRKAAYAFNPAAKGEISIERKESEYHCTEVYENGFLKGKKLRSQVYWELHSSFGVNGDRLQAFVHGVVRGMKLAKKPREKPRGQ